MPNFNLLPTEERKEIEAEQIRASIISIFRVIFFVLICVAISLLSIYFCLDSLTAEQDLLIKEKKQDDKYKEFKKVEKKISFLNSNISKIYDIRSQTSQTLFIIEDLINLIPKSHLFLTSINIVSEYAVPPALSENKEEKDQSEENENEAGDEESKPSEVDGEGKTKKVEEKTPVAKEYFWQIEVLGLAENREAVLEFKKSLEKSLIFSGIESPIENIIPSQDISFKFNFKYEKD